MRSFTFDVLVRESSNGYTRIVEGGRWLRLAERLCRNNRVDLTENSRIFAGYGGSYEVVYTRYTFTVTELPGAFSA